MKEWASTLLIIGSLGALIIGLHVQTSARITRLEDRMIAEFASVDARFDELNSKLIDMSARIGRLEGAQSQQD